MSLTVEIKDLGQSELEISGELSVEAFASFRPAVIKDYGSKIQIDGFRTGHIPEKVIVDKVGEEAILLEMAELALKETYPKIVEEHKLDVIGRPEINLTKVAPGNPLGFKIKTAIMPKVELPDYQAIAKEVLAGNKIDIADTTEDELSKALANLQKELAHQGHQHGLEEKGDHEHSLPALDDELAKKFGLETLDELKFKIKEGIKNEKLGHAKEQRRLKMIEAIGTASKLELPPVLIENEQDKMLAEMEDQTARMGLKFDDYLGHLKKTREELKETWAAEAKKRVTFGLILNAISQAEKIEAPAEELQKEVDYLATRYADVDEARLRSYANTLLVNEKTLEFLENAK
ncbi:MAG: trigger factor [Patescibacteria group bacterium]